NFFGNYTVTETVANNFTFTNYIGFLTMFVLAAGIIFELPMAVYFLSKIGLLTPKFMRDYRKHSVVGILFISAIITPADIGTQLLVALPVYVLYEMSIFISAKVERDFESG
ncbi:MAG TPA: preprotein translocase subunit TatC, partial [Flavobacteriales bacterium]|nr:preprotein translocase subunit TatC [Flavobacteriales bacterium]